MKPLFDYRRFKKIDSDEHSTTFQHPKGHKITVAHKGLSPKIRGELAALPTFKADGGEISPKEDDVDVKIMKQRGVYDANSPEEKLVNNLKTNAGAFMGSMAPVAAEGEAISAASGRPAFMKSAPPAYAASEAPGATTPNSVDSIRTAMNQEYEANGLSNNFKKLQQKLSGMFDKGYADGGKVNKMADGGGATTKSANDIGTTRSYTAEEWAAKNKDKPESGSDEEFEKNVKDVKQYMNYAEGGEAEPAAQYDKEGEKGHTTNIYVGGTAPQDSQQTDPAIAREKELYNQQVMNPLTLGTGQAPLHKGETFNPEQPEQEPANFDPEKFKEAESEYKGEEANKAQGIKQTVEGNKVRERAGLSPIPVPENPSPTDAATAAPSPDVTAGAKQLGINDPYGTEAYYQGMQAGIGEQKAGISGEAAAQTQLGQQTAQALNEQVQQQQEARRDYQTHFNDLNQERQNFLQDIKNQHINPDHYLNSMGTGQKVATGIGLILGGLGSGLTHTPNMAAQFLQNQIDNDVNAQRAELGKKENLLSANMRQFGNLRDAMDMTRIMQNDIVSNQLRAAAATAQGPLAQSRALQAAGQLDMQTAPIMSQIAMRRTLMSGMQQGRVAPEQVIRMVVPEHEQQYATKELKDAQGMIRSRDNILSSFDQVAQINTVGNRLMNPIQASRQTAALRDPLIAGLSKETAGRFTEQDAHYLATLFPSPGDNQETIMKKRMQINKIVGEKMNFPELQKWGINVTGNAGRYSPTGAPKFKEAPPVLPKQ